MVLAGSGCRSLIARAITSLRADDRSPKDTGMPVIDDWWHAVKLTHDLE